MNIARTGGKTVAEIAAGMPVITSEPQCGHYTGWAPKAPVVKWGARGIIDEYCDPKKNGFGTRYVTAYVINLLHDRQEMCYTDIWHDGKVEKVTTAFKKWLYQCIIALNRRGKKMDPAVSRSSMTLIQYESPDGLFHFVANAKNSGGYMYMYAWVDQGVDHE